MRTSFLIAASTVALSIASSAYAADDVQSAGEVSAPAADDAGDSGLQDIIVTATRRSASLQKVPATIAAVTSETLETFNVKGVLQLPTLTSGIVVTPSGANNVFMRGIGSASTGYNEAQTGLYIDGLYLANPAMGIFSFNNIDRIEVLKGPQGTLYGRNVTGGLISVITRDPDLTATHVDLSAGYATYETLQLNGYASTPLSEKVAANISVYHQKQSKGWMRNTFLGTRIQKSDETAAQAKLLFEPDDLTRITLSGIYNYNNRNFGYGYQVKPGTLGTDGSRYLGEYRTALRVDPRAPFKAYVGSLKIERDLGFARLMSISGYQTSHADVLFPTAPILGTTAAGQGALYNQFYQKNRTISQEFQLTSAKDSAVDWVAGTFYYNDNTRLQLDTFSICVNGVCPPGAAPTRNTGLPKTRSYSAYGDVTFHATESTHLTGGLRYTDETKRLSGLVTPLPGFPNSVATLPATTILRPGQPFAGFPNGIPTKLHFKKLTYRVVVAQDIGDNIHLYASHNLGFKSGAFNGNAFNNPPARPELLYATEVGMKSQLLDNRVRFNIAYFHYTYKDVQVRSTAAPAAPGNALLLNAAAEKVDGIDVDFSASLFPGFVINGSAEYLNARYKDFPGTTCTTPGTRVVNGVTVGFVTSVTCNLAGNSPPQAPKYSATLGFVYTLDTASGKFIFSGNDHYTSRYYLNAEHSITQVPRHLIDASLTWKSPDERYDVQLWGRNLTDKIVYGVGNVAANYHVVPGAPRTYGATVGVHF